MLNIVVNIGRQTIDAVYRLGRAGVFFYVTLVGVARVLPRFGLVATTLCMVVQPYKLRPILTTVAGITSRLILGFLCPPTVLQRLGIIPSVYGLARMHYSGGVALAAFMIP